MLRRGVAWRGVAWRGVAGAECTEAGQPFGARCAGSIDTSLLLAQAGRPAAAPAASPPSPLLLSSPLRAQCGQSDGVNRLAGRGVRHGAAWRGAWRLLATAATSHWDDAALLLWHQFLQLTVPSTALRSCNKVKNQLLTYL